jgi:hypothetical protein
LADIGCRDAGGESTTVGAIMKFERGCSYRSDPTSLPRHSPTMSPSVGRTSTPDLGSKRIDRLTVRDVRLWMNDRVRCQCCAQGKDARRRRPTCCAIGLCCRQIASEWTRHEAWTVLQSALTAAVRDELVSRNVAALVKVPVPKGSPSSGLDCGDGSAQTAAARERVDFWFDPACPSAGSPHAGSWKPKKCAISRSTSMS